MMNSLPRSIAPPPPPPPLLPPPHCLEKNTSSSSSSDDDDNDSPLAVRLVSNRIIFILILIRSHPPSPTSSVVVYTFNATPWQRRSRSLRVWWDYLCFEIRLWLQRRPSSGDRTHLQFLHVPFAASFLPMTSPFHTESMISHGLVPDSTRNPFYHHLGRDGSSPLGGTLTSSALPSTGVHVSRIACTRLSPRSRPPLVVHRWERSLISLIREKEEEKGKERKGKEEEGKECWKENVKTGKGWKNANLLPSTKLFAVETLSNVLHALGSSLTSPSDSLPHPLAVWTVFQLPVMIRRMMMRNDRTAMSRHWIGGTLSLERQVGVEGQGLDQKLSLAQLSNPPSQHGRGWTLESVVTLKDEPQSIVCRDQLYFMLQPPLPSVADFLPPVSSSKTTNDEPAWACWTCPHTLLHAFQSSSNLNNVYAIRHTCLADILTCAVHFQDLDFIVSERAASCQSIAFIPRMLYVWMMSDIVLASLAAPHEVQQAKCLRFIRYAFLEDVPVGTSLLLCAKPMTKGWWLVRVVGCPSQQVLAVCSIQVQSR